MTAATRIQQRLRTGPRVPGVLLALVGGVLASVLLVSGIRLLVAVDGAAGDQPRSGSRLDFVRLPPPTEAPQPREQPDPPPKPEPTPTTPSMPVMAAPAAPRAELPPIDVPGIDRFAVDGSGFNLGQRQAGEFQPLVKIAPVYPGRALNRGVEGDCTVRYTVTPQGTVTDVVVVEDACDSYLFETPSIDAARRFRYQPRMVNGEAVAVPGVRNKFEFRIQEQ
ncbi:TonB family protein [Marinobacter bohaiensis]|uniref:TonB family protein n=1 Tax=Marinobacter bohaiensis TaxID=2201898 RepID=UPI000DAB8255|nr:TonB family protein [Marinobacter bohaiensis]